MWTRENEASSAPSREHTWHARMATIIEENEPESSMHMCRDAHSEGGWTREDVSEMNCIPERTDGDGGEDNRQHSDACYENEHNDNGHGTTQNDGVDNAHSYYAVRTPVADSLYVQPEESS